MLKVSQSRFRQIVRASAVYDIVLTAPFATPWSFALIYQQLSSTNQQLGGLPLPAFHPFHILIACLFGSIVLVWSALRLVQPEQRLGRFDGAARMLFSLWMAWALHETGAPLLWLFLVPEFSWGVVQWLPVGREAAIAQASWQLNRG
jgi:hypothetical protein